MDKTWITWICPQYGVVNKVRVEETTKRTFERNSIGVFEVSIARVRMKVYWFDIVLSAIQGVIGNKTEGTQIRTRSTYLSTILFLGENNEQMYLL